MKRFLVEIMLAAAVVSLVGCAGNLPPVSAVANAAGQVERTGLVILHAAQAAHTQTNPKTGGPLVTTKQLDYVALQCSQLGKVGTSLAQLLDAYESVKAAKGDTTQLTFAIQTAVKQATDILANVGTAVPKGTVQSIDQAVAQAIALYVQIKTIAL